MNKNISKLLIFLMITSMGVIKAYGYAEAEQSLQVTVQPAVAISKDSSSIETGTVNPETGVHTGLSPTFNIKTNGDDGDYDFIMTSKILVDGGTVSAYGDNGCILFGHTFNYPTVEAIENAKIKGNNNRNVIAYPVTMSITNPMTASYQTGYSTYGDCYVIKVNNATDGKVIHNVGKNPYSGTYLIGQDQAGIYQAVVTLTAVSK